MKVLLAVDGSDFSKAAVKQVARRPWPTGSEVKVISVVEPVMPPTPEAWGMSMGDYLAEQAEWRRSQARQALDSAARTLAASEDETLKVTTEIRDGSPKQVIVEEAEAWGADLVVVGSHGYGFWDRLLLGSVSQAVASHASCSVEIVRRPSFDEGDGAGR